LLRHPARTRGTLDPLGQDWGIKGFLLQNVGTFFFPLFVPYPYTPSVGRETITVTWPSSRPVTSARLPPIWHTMPTNRPPMLPRPNWLPRTPSVWVWLSTFPSSTTRFRIHRTRLANWPSRHSMMPLPSWTHCRKSPTKILL
jgi:hypothetical protein